MFVIIKLVVIRFHSSNVSNTILILDFWSFQHLDSLFLYLFTISKHIEKPSHLLTFLTYYREFILVICKNNIICMFIFFQLEKFCSAAKKRNKTTIKCNAQLLLELSNILHIFILQLLCFYAAVIERLILICIHS